MKSQKGKFKLCPSLGFQAITWNSLYWWHCSWDKAKTRPQSHSYHNSALRHKPWFLVPRCTLGLLLLEEVSQNGETHTSSLQAHLSKGRQHWKMCPTSTQHKISRAAAALLGHWPHLTMQWMEQTKHMEERAQHMCMLLFGQGHFMANSGHALGSIQLQLRVLSPRT